MGLKILYAYELTRMIDENIDSWDQLNIFILYVLCGTQKSSLPQLAGVIKRQVIHGTHFETYCKISPL